ncbi:Hypothetical predicted protein [Mytilus galloprovincialis]|uniref:DDE Tnp4 domain-containing protein n=1 Tax=Mytilus galloprovincialis TaxID=29158 RepID=A0A8B6C6T6_MYTGA|nr:Hypothetical predicted protein [Mytilus galloprovincialis]
MASERSLRPKRDIDWKKLHFGEALPIEKAQIKRATFAETFEVERLISRKISKNESSKNRTQLFEKFNCRDDINHLYHYERTPGNIPDESIKFLTSRFTVDSGGRETICIFLTKMRSGMSNKLMATIFNVGKDSIRRAVTTVRKNLMQTFVPKHLGFNHISRENLIENHTRPLAQTLFGNEFNPAILVIDGTYIYIQKSGQFQFQRRTFSMHKHRPLVKPMVFVTTTGYFVSVMGPYLADSKNNDANILKHIIASDNEQIKSWLQKDDVFIVDRGFRDSIDLLEELGIQTEMPSFLKKGQAQFTTEESNTSRLITKIRWRKTNYLDLSDALRAKLVRQTQCLSKVTLKMFPCELSSYKILKRKNAIDMQDW